MDNRIETVYLKVEQLIPDEENPNKQKDAVFNALVENIQEIGMVEPIMVAPHYDEDGNVIEGEYKIVSGHHRYEACKLLDYEEIPCIVQEDFDEDMAKFQMVRMNMLSGELDPVKFTKLYNKMADKYGEELTKQAMALVDEKKFERLYLDVKKELPKELQDKLDDARDDIETVDDLSRILNTLFTKYGDTLDYHFMVFTYGGKTQLWVMMEKNVKKKVIDELVPELSEYGIDINDYFNVLLDEYGLDDEILEKAMELSNKRGRDEIEF